jgi:broad specificity phosphatase PhoE
MTLYLVRHGKAEAGVEHPDPGLDAVGKAQAERAAEALRAVGAVRLVSSPLRRARETASPIASSLGLTPIIRQEVAEVFDPAMPVDARRGALIPLLSGKWSEQSPALQKWRENVLAALVELGEEKTIVVSHFVAICAAIGAATEDDRVSPCALANASITTMQVVDGRLTLRRPGEVSHLSRDEITASHPLIGKR